MGTPIAGTECVYRWVDDEDGLQTALRELEAAPIINVDFVGQTICIGQFQASGSPTVHVMDFVHFQPRGVVAPMEGRLRALLEDERVCKVFFDPRHDCHALWHQYKVRVRGALCLQVAEVAFRRTNLGKNHPEFVFGLAKVCEKYRTPSVPSPVLQRVRAAGVKLFAPELGGSYDVFHDRRPLPSALLEYCALDVFVLDDLRRRLYDTLPQDRKDQVRTLSDQRIEECLLDPTLRETARAPRIL